MIDSISGEVEVDLLESITEELPKLKSIHSTDHSILIHGMGGQTRSFYNKLRHNPALELMWTGWSSNVWWTYLLSFIPGQAGLSKVIDRQQLNKLYFDIGQLSTCGLYFIPNGIVNIVLENVRKDRTPRLNDLLKDEQNYFLLTVDFDYHGDERDGEVFYRELVIGDALDSELEQVLTRTE